MESSKLYKAIKANDAIALETLMTNTSPADAMIRDAKGHTLLHKAVLTGADISILNVLLDNLDISVRDKNCQTALDLIFDGFYPEAGAQVFKNKLKKLLLGGRKEDQKQAKTLLLAGWTFWPMTVEEAKQKSADAARILEKLLKLQVIIYTGAFVTFYKTELLKT